MIGQMWSHAHPRGWGGRGGHFEVNNPISTTKSETGTSQGRQGSVRRTSVMGKDARQTEL